jgi:plastocyanin
MQQMGKRFTIPALAVMITLFAGGLAFSLLNTPARAMVGAGVASARSTPTPVNQAAPALQAVATFTVAVSSNIFSPTAVTIAPGDTVLWQRADGFHNVVADDGSFRLGEGDSGSPGSSWTTGRHTFNTAGTFRYYCEIHGAPGGRGMSGVVIVQDAAATPTPTATSPAPNKVYMPVITTS